MQNVVHHCFSPTLRRCDLCLTIPFCYVVLHLNSRLLFGPSLKIIRENHKTNTPKIYNKNRTLTLAKFPPYSKENVLFL